MTGVDLTTEEIYCRPSLEGGDDRMRYGNQFSGGIELRCKSRLFWGGLHGDTDDDRGSVSLRKKLYELIDLLPLWGRLNP
jgi:hypothetical protein